jgi:DNA-binding transcriptional regulator YiaG
MTSRRASKKLGRTGRTHAPRPAPAWVGSSAKALWTSLEDAERQSRGLVTLRTTTLPKPPPRRTPGAIALARRRAGLSQAVLAGYLNVSTKAVQSWEQGTRTPKAGEARLLQMFACDPAQFTAWVRGMGA